MNERPINSLSELMDGVVEERFNEELMKVLENVCDPNTSYKTAREINLKLKIVPNERRDVCALRFSCTSKLASKEEYGQTVMINMMADGTIRATERTAQVPGQLDVFGNEQEVPTTVEFRAVK